MPKAEKRTIEINRAPVLTLWAAVVAEALGFDRPAALSLGKGLAGLNAQSKGRRLGIFKPGAGAADRVSQKVGLGEEFWIELCGRAVPAKHTEEGVRAVVKDKPVQPDRVERYLNEKFGTDLSAVRGEMERLAEGFGPEQLGEHAYSLYEAFRPEIPPGVRGWGAKGTLDLDQMRGLASER